MQGYEKFFKAARRAKASNASAQPPPRFVHHPSETGKAESAEARLQRLVRERNKRKREMKKQKKVEFPWGAAVTVFFGLMIALTCFFNPAATDWVLDHIEVGAFGSAQASEGAPAAKPPEKETKSEKGAENSKETEKLAGLEGQAAAKSSTDKSAAKGESMPDTKSWSQEEISFFNKLDERKKELDLREAELTKLEEELQKQKLELDEKIKLLEKTRMEIAKTLKTQVETDQEKVTKLVDVYAGMKPQQAAKVIETINEDLAVKVLDQMKKKSAADILNVMTAQKAQRLSEMLAGYKRP